MNPYVRLLSIKIMNKMTTTSLFNLVKQQQYFENRLNELFIPHSHIPDRLYEALRYVLFAKAKRIRPLLIYATGICFKVPISLLDIPAVAVECIHTYSLVHDDLPAMDNDDLRRGQLTCHKAFDEATAILVGDALQNIAFEILSRGHPKLCAEQQLRMIHLLAEATGAKGMIGGQFLDMQFQGNTPSLTSIKHMHALKTGALIRASILMAANMAEDCSKKQLAALSTFSDLIGLAFQIKDDILDVESHEVQLGKTVGADNIQKKASILTALSLTEAKDTSEHLLQQAEACLSTLPEPTQPLLDVARFIIERDH